MTGWLIASALAALVLVGLLLAMRGRAIPGLPGRLAGLPKPMGSRLTRRLRKNGVAWPNDLAQRRNG